VFFVTEGSARKESKLWIEVEKGSADEERKGPSAVRERSNPERYDRLKNRGKAEWGEGNDMKTTTGGLVIAACMGPERPPRMTKTQSTKNRKKGPLWQHLVLPQGWEKGRD